MHLPTIDQEELLDFLRGLLDTPSPTGYTHEAIQYIQKSLAEFPEFHTCLTPKGALLITWNAGKADAPRALTAHVDTLGAMVKEIKSDGRLRLSRVGGMPWNSVEAEGCTIFRRGQPPLRGSILPVKASVHVYGKEVTELKRDDENMEVRIDAPTGSKAETQSLGIAVGDFVAIDARVEMHHGFIRSRHLDDKAGVACILIALKTLWRAGLAPFQKTYALISNYEEVGHGGSGDIPGEAKELLVVDMAAIGEGQNSDEYHASLCLKDSSGPYHYEFSQRLRNLAEAYGIPYRTDIYPSYTSDGSAYWRAGGAVPVALIGPGVDASHHYERTHVDALISTTQWIMAYLLSEKTG